MIIRRLSLESLDNSCIICNKFLFVDWPYPGVSVSQTDGLTSELVLAFKMCFGKALECELLRIQVINVNTDTNT